MQLQLGNAEDWLQSAAALSSQGNHTDAEAATASALNPTMFRNHILELRL